MRLGIDFGTCFSNAALMMTEDSLQMVKDPVKHGYSFPSSVYVTERGELLIGSVAENARQRDLRRYKREFKRELGQNIPYQLGERSFKPEELVSAVLGEIKTEAEKIVEGYGHPSVTSTLITMPATYQDYKRGLMEQAARAAGFGTVALLEEPVAAAIYYSWQRRDRAVKKGEIILVYDLGGGTFDAALIQKNGHGYQFLTAPLGLSQCGGVDFDRQIYTDLATHCRPQLAKMLTAQRRDIHALRARNMVQDSCRNLKHQLSQARSAQISIPISIEATERYDLTREKFNRMIKPFLDETIQLCQQLIENAGIKREQVDGILLVGGSCRIPYVRELLEQQLERPVFRVDDPDLAVCRGAAIYGFELDQKQAPPIVSAAGGRRKNNSKVIERAQPSHGIKVERRVDRKNLVIEKPVEIVDDGSVNEFAFSSVEDYRRVEKLAIQELTRLRQISQQVGLERDIIKLIDDVLARNEENKFRIAVVGEFNRGKSTFINALLGMEVLPSDILPTTATLNRVTYGRQPLVRVMFKSKNGMPERVVDIGINQLPDYVTKLSHQSKTTAADVKEAIVYYPVPYCQNNVEIIDTPGLNDDEAMTSVTVSVIPHVSAAIFVIMPESPFSGSEGDFLHNKLLLSEMGRVIFVVNAMDRVKNPVDRERILKEVQNRIKTSIETRLRQQFGINTEKYKLYRKRIGEPKVFGLSSYDALESKLNNDQALLAGSCFPEFERALEKFLTQTRGAIELQQLANRSVAASDEILKKLQIEVGALQMGQTEFDKAYEKASAELQTLRQRRQLEWSRIGSATKRTKEKVAPMLMHWDEQLKIAASHAIDHTPVQPNELGSMDSLQEKLGREVSQAVGNAGKKVGERIQLQIEQDLESEANRLNDFAAMVSQTLRQIELQFAQVDPTFQNNQGSKDALALVVGGVTGTLWGGVLSGYNEAGGKGAAVGGAAGFGTFMAGFALLGALSLPVTWPAAIALGVASTFAGKFLTRKVFGTDRVEKFKQSYKQQVLMKLDEQLRTQRLDIQVNDNIDSAYRLLKEQVIGEVNALIEQTQKTLNELHRKKARQETLTEQRRQELDKVRIEVEQIRSKALRLSEQLIEINHI